MYGAFTLSGRLSQNLSITVFQYVLQSEPRDARIPVWALPFSLAATHGIDVSFSSSEYLDVSVPRVPPAWLWIHHAAVKVSLTGFPHSDICGSQDICSLPQLFAAYHVFLRLLVPRHPPCALIRLTFFLPLPCSAFLLSHGSSGERLKFSESLRFLFPSGSAFCFPFRSDSSHALWHGLSCFTYMFF